MGAEQAEKIRRNKCSSPPRDSWIPRDPTREPTREGGGYKHSL